MRLFEIMSGLHKNIFHLLQAKVKFVKGILVC